MGSSVDPGFAAVLRRAKLRLLQLHNDANCGHIGGNFSCIEALMTLHHVIMKGGDKFILSKGHAAGALYVTLWSLGQLSDAELATFTADNSTLPAHPSGSNIPGLMFATGSLGHGPSLAAGLALAARHKGTNHRVYCLCSDGEWQEGSCWEALTFAVHQRLSNLVILVDQNGMQGFGSTAEVVSCSDLTPRISGFGADVVKIDGHDPAALVLASSCEMGDLPRMIILETIKGRGLAFEGKLESHYLPLTDEGYQTAKTRIEQLID